MKSRRWRPLVGALILFVPSVGHSEIDSLGVECQRLGVRTVLVVPSQALDEGPVWSPDGTAIGVNVEGSWRRVSLAGLAVTKAKWHGEESLGVVASPPLTALSQSDVLSWMRVGKRDPRKVVTTSGLLLEMKPEELGTAFLITPRDKPAEVIWKTSLESCHGLALSPDESFVAYICELNGLLVTKI